jgi:hypothetical protein
VRTGGDELHLLLPVRPDDRQRTGQFLAVERFSRFVLHIQIQRSLFHDKLDGDRIVTATDYSTVLGFVVAMGVSRSQRDEAENRCGDDDGRLHIRTAHLEHPLASFRGKKRLDALRIEPVMLPKSRGKRAGPARFAAIDAFLSDHWLIRGQAAPGTFWPI